MSCPPEIAAILADILRNGLLRIRGCGWNGDAARCAVEADHLHNLPTIASSFSPELLEFYWTVERAEFIKRSAKDDLAVFEPFWSRLEKFVTSIDPVVIAEAFAKEHLAAGYRLDFSLASLEVEVDRLLKLPIFHHGRKRAATDEEERNQAALGAYVGESLRRLFGGEWVGSFSADSCGLNFYRSFIMFGSFRFEPHAFLAYRLTNGASEGRFREYLEGLVPRIKDRTNVPAMPSPSPP